MKQALTTISLTVVISAILLYFLCGVFVLQPMDSLPNGGTVVYFRQGSNLPFISSVDAVLQNRESKITTVARKEVIRNKGNLVMSKKLFVFPYSQRFYLMSTDGRVYVQ